MGYFLMQLSILGATGSIGKSTLSLVRENRDKFSIYALSANSNVELVVALAKEFQAKVIVVSSYENYLGAKSLLGLEKIKLLYGQEGLCEIAAEKNTKLVSAIVGMAGLKPTMAAINAHNDVALANKESIVCAGELMMSAAKASKIIPVDSEHNAIFQVFDFDNPQFVEKIILTASGGPFLHYTQEQLRAVTKSQALKHPRWQMGPKISIDSATLMNKALEMIEAHYLFNIDFKKIEVVIHPQSIIHSLVEYVDGSHLAQLGVSDMRIPIAYALNWPQRFSNTVPKLDLASIGELTFFKANNYPALKLVQEVMRLGQGAKIVMNAANELAVEAFLADKIPFINIIPTIERVLEHFSFADPKNLDEVFAIDKCVRERFDPLFQ
jgi:1-deoxy-D-xylulose-5-phosphate reductoisomerase